VRPTGDGTREASGEVTLREITAETVDEVLRLKVAPHQERNVATNAKSIAQAHFHPDIAWFRAVYAGETPVGFVMVEDKPAERSYYLWRFMIAEPYQGRGYGRRALDLVIEHVSARPGATALLTGAHPGPDSAIPFYESMGFVLTGEVDPEDGELEMRIDLPARADGPSGGPAA
jgi:diamine N-acetyltransferase